MNRGHIGVLPRAPRLEDDSYLDFMEAMRNFNTRTLFAKILPLTFDPQNESSAAIRGWKRLMRSQQQQTWQKVLDRYASERGRWEAELDAAEKKRPGRLHYDPAFQVPRDAALDIHLQPGGYVNDTLAGYVFHHGTKVFYQGENDQDELHHQVASFVVPPADGKIARILDLGCSIGQGTTALKQRFPQAEVTGLDVGLPMVRYAHKRAVDLDIDVHFRHGLAEDTQLPSGSFDAILCYILFHEVPERLFPVILREIHRLLRPGGTLTVVDAPNNKNLPAPNRFWLKFDSAYNCEPYSPAFVASDFRGLIAAAGFEVTHVGPTPTFLHLTTAVKNGP